MRVLGCVVALCVIAGWVTPSAAQAPAATSSPYVPVTRFDPSRDAARDVADAVKEATQSGKHILLDVGGEWCIWCKRLDTLFVRDKDLRDFLESHYVTVKVNYSKENKNETTLSRYPKIRGFPHLFVLDSDGALLHSQDTGELEKGKGHDPDLVMTFLKKWAP